MNEERNTINASSPMRHEPPLRVGDIVVVSDPNRASNGTHEHPAIVTNTWGSRDATPTINVKVLPDCGEPYDATSIQHWKATPYGSKYHYRLRDEAVAL